ncbi:MAG TPA: hypothetical protein VHO06_14200 [Polyangia bacterium]|nr:hypothetical protein [Polyangia bacterium]
MTHLPSSSRIWTRAALWAAATSVALLAAAPARAQELAPPAANASSNSGGFAPAAMPANFGAAGEWVVSVASFNGGASGSLVKQSSGGTSVGIQPALDYFLGNGISVGGLVGYAYGGGISTVDIGARAGFNQALTERVSFWPTVGIVGSYQTGNHVSSSAAKLAVLAPFLYHVAPHFFLGAGPFLSYLVKGGPDTEYGLDFVIGGWF